MGLVVGVTLVMFAGMLAVEGIIYLLHAAHRH